ncbi:hypothetical protein D3C81_1816050 [compost metagenome]
MRLGEGIEYFIATVQLAVLAHPRQQFAHDREMCGGAGQRDVGVADAEHLVVLFVGMR